MDKVSHVILEHRSNCDAVSTSCFINLPRQDLFLNSSVAVDIYLLYLRQ